MYPDTTGGAFGRDTPPPPIPPAAGAAWIPAQRGPWEPPPRQQGEPAADVPVPAQPEGASGSRPTVAGPAAAGPTVPLVDEGTTDPAEGAHDSVDGVETIEPDRPETAEVTEVTEITEPADAETPEPADAETPEPARAEENGPESVDADAEAAEPRAGTARALRPGDLPQTRIALWGGASAAAEAFRERIREAGNLFVDDPNFAVTATAAVVTEAVNALAAALARQHAELDPRHSSDNPDTEALRVAVLRYRELLDRVLAL